MKPKTKKNTKIKQKTVTYYHHRLPPQPTTTTTSTNLNKSLPEPMDKIADQHFVEETLL